MPSVRIYSFPIWTNTPNSIWRATFYTLQPLQSEWVGYIPNSPAAVDPDKTATFSAAPEIPGDREALLSFADAAVSD